MRLRKMRLDNAQIALTQAIAEVQLGEQKLAYAQEEYDTYVRELPAKVDALYEKIMGKKVDTIQIGEVLQEQALLAKRVPELGQVVKACEQQLEQAKAKVIEARAQLALCERKQMGLQELIKVRKKQQSRLDNQRDARVLDEFSTNQFVAKMC